MRYWGSSGGNGGAQEVLGGAWEVTGELGRYWGSSGGTDVAGESPLPTITYFKLYFQ